MSEIIKSGEQVAGSEAEPEAGERARLMAEGARVAARGGHSLHAVTEATPLPLVREAVAAIKRLTSEEDDED